MRAASARTMRGSGPRRRRARRFVIGLVIFSVSSLLSGLAQSRLWLNLARGAQGIGGAAMFSTSLALLGSAFQGRERGTAFGAWGAITFVGDSAGASIAIATTLRLLGDGATTPGHVIAISPWLDMQNGGSTIETNNDSDFLITREGLQGNIDRYLSGGASPTDPLVNPLYADLAGLGPLYIQVGGDETLLDDSRRLAERAREAGIEVTLDIFPEMQHVFHFAAGYAPEADDAIRKLALWIRPKLGLA